MEKMDFEQMERVIGSAIRDHFNASVATFQLEHDILSDTVRRLWKFEDECEQPWILYQVGNHFSVTVRLGVLYKDSSDVTFVQYDGEESVRRYAFAIGKAVSSIRDIKNEIFHQKNFIPIKNVEPREARYE